MALAGSIYGELILKTAKWTKSITRVLTRDLPKIASGFKRMSSSLNQMGNSMTMAGAAMAASTGLIAASFIKAADTADSYKMRLSVLLGSAKEGNKTFRTMALLAGKVPQQYEEIMRSAVGLAGVMDDGRKGIEMWMPMLTDLASAYGLSMEVITGNFIRAYSAGISASDKFREAGIANMMRFKAGVEYSVEETREMMYKSWARMGSRFRGTTNELAKIWQGVMSMLKDKWFLFRVAIMDDTKIWQILKAHVTSLNIALTRNWEAMINWINTNGKFLRQAALSIASVLALGVALTTAGIALKFMAFGLGAFAVVLSGIPLLLNPFILLLGVIIASFYTLRAVWKDSGMGFKEFVLDLWAKIKPLTTEIWSQLLRIGSGIAKFLKDVINSVTRFVLTMWESFKWLVKRIEGLFKWLVTTVNKSWDVIREALNPRMLWDKSLHGPGSPYATAIDEWVLHWKRGIEDVKNAHQGALKERVTEIYATDYVDKWVESVKTKTSGLINWWEINLPIMKIASKLMWESIKKQWEKDLSSIMAATGKEGLFTEVMAGMKTFASDYAETYRELMLATVEETAKAMGDILGAFGGAFDAMESRADSFFKSIGPKWDMMSFQLQAKAYNLFQEIQQMALEAHPPTLSFEDFFGMKTGLDLMRSEWETFAEFMYWKLNEIAATLERSMSGAFQSVIKKQKSLKEASRDFLADIGNQIIKTISDIAAHDIASMIFAEKTKDGIRKEGAAQSILLRWWQSNQERSIEERDLAFKTVMAAKEVALNMWKAAKNVAIAIWEAVASIWKKFSGIWGGPALAAGESAGMIAAVSALATGIGAGGMQAMLNGSDMVSRTGPYWLHRGEAVKPRAEVGAGGDEAPWQIHNYVGDAAIRAAMSGIKGKRIVQNHIVEGFATNAEVRTYSRRYG